MYYQKLIFIGIELIIYKLVSAKVLTLLSFLTILISEQIISSSLFDSFENLSHKCSEEKNKMSILHNKIFVAFCSVVEERVFNEIRFNF